MATEMRFLAHVTDQATIGYCTAALQGKAATDTKPHSHLGAKPEIIASADMVRGLISLI